MKLSISRLIFLLIFASVPASAVAQESTRWKPSLIEPQDYTLKRVSSADPSGGNADFRPIEPAERSPSWTPKVLVCSRTSGSRCTLPSRIT